MTKLKHSPKGGRLSQYNIHLTQHIERYHKSLYIYDEPHRYTPEQIDILHEAVKDLRPNQQRIMNYWLDGYSQHDIASIMKVKQQTIHTAIWGNTIKHPKTGENIKYGGIIKKLKRFCLSSGLFSETPKKE